MTLPEMTTQTLAAWIAAVLAIGVVALAPSTPADDPGDSPRRIIADVSIGGPMTRGATDDGERMLPFEYDLAPGDWGSQDRLPLAVDAES